MIAVEPGELREPQPGAEEGLDQSPIAQAAQVVDVRSGEQAAQLVAIEEFQRPRRRLAEFHPVGTEHLQALQRPVAQQRAKRDQKIGLGRAGQRPAGVGVDVPGEGQLVLAHHLRGQVREVAHLRLLAA